MSKICAKCEKAVYPLEELKCLDKIWHKVCFKCWECGMALNMKNYKGYNKFPYCNAHYPQTKHTVVADTPELQRLSQASKIQSQIKYHEDFEKNIKGSKIQIANDPETQRMKQLNSFVSQVEYKGLREKTGEMEAKRKGADVNSDGQTCQSHSVAYTDQGKVDMNHSTKKIGSIMDYDPIGPNASRTPKKQTQEWEETVPIGSHHGNSSPLKHVRQNASPSSQQNNTRSSASKTGKKVMGMMCRALYDYTAQDTDEVTFLEDDVIVNCEPIDDGWMYGTVQRTGLRGMLPSNYVEKI